MTDEPDNSNDLMDFFSQDQEGSSSDQSQLDPPLPPTLRVKARREAAQRRKKKRIQGFFQALIALILIVGLIFTATIVVRGIKQAKKQQDTSLAVKDCSDYSGPGTDTVEFTVSRGEGSGKIAEDLVKAGVVKSSCAFNNAVSGAEASQSLQPGTFSLKKKMKASDVVAILVDPSKAKAILNIVQGDTVKKVIAKAAAASDHLTLADYQKVIDNKGKGILPAEAGGSFEGWLQEGTYEVKDATSAQAVLKKIVNARIDHLNSLNVPQGSKRETILIKASIAQAEVNRSDYYGKVIRVIENRLAKDMTLGMDTINAYGFGLDDASQLTKSQLADSNNAYNSRIHKGLPPTPISNPGDDAIKAAINPPAGNWLYFVTVNLDTGETKFTDNSKTFNTYVKEYQQWSASRNK